VVRNHLGQVSRLRPQPPSSAAATPKKKTWSNNLVTHTKWPGFRPPHHPSALSPPSTIADASATAAARRCTGLSLGPRARPTSFGAALTRMPRPLPVPLRRGVSRRPDRCGVFDPACSMRRVCAPLPMSRCPVRLSTSSARDDDRSKRGRRGSRAPWGAAARCTHLGMSVRRAMAARPPSQS
jgi:hypothetical protein